MSKNIFVLFIWGTLNEFCAPARYYFAHLLNKHIIIYAWFRHLLLEQVWLFLILKSQNIKYSVSSKFALLRGFVLEHLQNVWLNQSSLFVQIYFFYWCIVNLLQYINESKPHQDKNLCKLLNKVEDLSVPYFRFAKLITVTYLTFQGFFGRVQSVLDLSRITSAVRTFHRCHNLSYPIIKQFSSKTIKRSKQII